MRRGDHDDVGQQLRPSVGGQLPARSTPLDARDALAPVHDLAAPHERRDERADVSPEHRPPHIKMAIGRPCVRVAAWLAMGRQPVQKIVGIIRNEAHAGRRHIRAMGGIAAIIGKARAEPVSRLEDHDGGAVAGGMACKVRRDHCAGEAAADNGNDRSPHSCHDWETFSFGR